MGTSPVHVWYRGSLSPLCRFLSQLDGTEGPGTRAGTLVRAWWHHRTWLRCVSEHANWVVGNQVRSFVKLTLYLTRVPALVSGPSSQSRRLKIPQSGDRPSPYTKHGLLMCLITHNKMWVYFNCFYLINQLTVYTQRHLFIFYFTCSLETTSTLY